MYLNCLIRYSYCIIRYLYCLIRYSYCIIRYSYCLIRCSYFLIGVSEFLARTRIHRVFYPCNRCHLATLLENQRVTCGNEVTRVTTKGVFTKILHAGCEAPGSKGRRCRLQGSEVPPPWVEAPGFEG